MKSLLSFGFGALFATTLFCGCGGSEGTPGGNEDAAKVIGVAPDSPEYGAASADMMSKMHGGDLPGAKKAAPKK